MILKKTIILQIVVAIMIVLPYIGMFFIYKWYNNTLGEIENAYFVLVSKQDMRLSIYDYKGEEIYNFPIACGLNFGDKKEQGDMKTPEGVFRVSEIQKAENWTHDFKDGNGEITGAFGPYFIRLNVPGYGGIGIHGTHNPGSLEKRATEGCIRLRNDDLLKAVAMIHHGTVVIITASVNDIINNSEGR